MHTHYFLAIPLPQQRKQSIHQAIGRTWPPTAFKKWVHVSDYHLTLVFLGAVSISTLEDIVQDLRKSLLTCPSFQITTDEANTFGDRKRPRIYWLGIKPNSALMDLQAHIKKVVASHEVKVETRPYTPHITLARTWQLEQEFQQQSLEQLGHQVKVDHVVVYQTIPHQEPKYKVIKEIKLG